MFNFWKSLTEQNKGIILLAIGIILLLHTLGVFTKGLNYVIIACAIYMVGLGLVKLDAKKKIMAYFNKK